MCPLICWILYMAFLQSSFQAILLGSFLILCVDQSTQKDWEHTVSKNWPAQLCCFGLRPSERTSPRFGVIFDTISIKVRWEQWYRWNYDLSIINARKQAFSVVPKASPWRWQSYAHYVTLGSCCKMASNHRVAGLKEILVLISKDEAPTPLSVVGPLFTSSLVFHLSQALLGVWRFSLFHSIYSSFHNRLDLIREPAFYWVFYFPKLSLFAYVKIKKGWFVLVQ